MKHIIIYSHGFGSDKTDRGLFTDISNSLPNSEHVMFWYNSFDSERNVTKVLPITEEAKMLYDIVEKTKNNNPDAIIDIICHSQGCIVAAIAKPVGARNIIMLAPGANYSNERMINNFGKRPGSVVDINGETIFKRSDGSMTVVPAEYWTARQNIEPIKYYNDLSSMTNLTIINANQDEFFQDSDFSGLGPNINVMNIDGKHNFGDTARPIIIDIIKNILV